MDRNDGLTYLSAMGKFYGNPNLAAEVSRLNKNMFWNVYKIKHIDDFMNDGDSNSDGVVSFNECAYGFFEWNIKLGLIKSSKN